MSESMYLTGRYVITRPIVTNGIFFDKRMRPCLLCHSEASLS